MWGGQYAAKFKPPTDDVASWLCILAIVVGLVIATWKTTHPGKGPKLNPA
jgi:hypothetical protein